MKGIHKKCIELISEAGCRVVRGVSEGCLSMAAFNCDRPKLWCVTLNFHAVGHLAVFTTTYARPVGSHSPVLLHRRTPLSHVSPLTTLALGVKVQLLSSYNIEALSPMLNSIDSLKKLFYVFVHWWVKKFSVELSIIWTRGSELNHNTALFFCVFFHPTTVLLFLISMNYKSITRSSHIK